MSALGRLLILVPGGLLPVETSCAATTAAQITVIGTTNEETVATVLRQTAGPALTVATSPANFGDLTLLVDGNPLPQANGVIIPAANQFRYGSVSDRNMIEVPGELTGTIPAGFPSGMWLSTTRVAGGGAEDNFNLSMVHFEFADGWTAGHVQGTDGALLAGNGTGVTITPQFDATFGNGHYTLSIAGVDSRSAGMLFAVGGTNSSSANVVPVGVLPDGTGWDVRVNDQGATFPLTEQANWSFVYVPFASRNLVAGGRLSLAPTNNSTGPPTSVDVLHGVGNFSASLVDIGNSTTNASIIPPAGGSDGLLDAGRILITIPGKDDTTGHLMVGVSKYASTTVFGADDNFLTCEYNAALGGFLVETYDLAGANLQNSDIYFAYFDYAAPLEIPDPTALVELSIVSLPGGQFELRSTGAGILQTSPNFASLPPWTDVGPISPDTPYVHAPPASETRRFFRLKP
jgi:hypothetical protein